MVLMGVSIYNQHARGSASLSAPGVKASTPASASALRESVYRFRVSTCYAYESLVLALCMRRALEEEQPCCCLSTSQMLTIHTNSWRAETSMDRQYSLTQYIQFASTVLCSQHTP